MTSTSLHALESEAVDVIRETFFYFSSPVLLFSGGKDSLVLLYLIEKALWPQVELMPLLHVDTGHNFPEVLAFRDETVSRLGLSLTVASVEPYIRSGKLPNLTSRNTLQSLPLNEAIKSGGYDAVFGGGRRDEDKARAKERVFSLRSQEGGWKPTEQAPEVWQIPGMRKAETDHFRVFPLSNWTEMNVWEYIDREGIPLPKLYYAHSRRVFLRDGMLLTAGSWGEPRKDEVSFDAQVRYRTVGDMSCTGAVKSEATNPDLPVTPRH